MADILEMTGLVTKHPIKADEMLRNIADDKPSNAFVIIWPEDGSKPTYHSSTADLPVILMRLQEFIHKHFSGDFHG